MIEYVLLNNITFYDFCWLRCVLLLIIIVV